MNQQRNQFKFNICRTFSAAKPKWLEFENRAELYVFQSYDWISYNYQKTDSLYLSSPCIVQVQQCDRETVMILPLCIRQTAGVRVLTWLGNELSDYHAPLIHRHFSRLIDKSQFLSLWKQLLKVVPEFDAIDFRKQPQYIGRQQNPLLFIAGVEAHQYNYFCFLPQDWEQFSKRQFTSKFRADCKRRLKRLQEKGRVSFEVFTPGAKADALLRQLIEQKQQRYLETGVYNILQHVEYRDLLLNAYHEKQSLAKMIHLSAILVNDGVIAMHWGVIFRQRFYHLMPSIDREWNQFAPGRLLLEHLYQWCFGQGIAVFDFTIGDEPYKAVWSNQKLPLFRNIRAFTLKGRCYVLLERLKDFVRSRPTLHRLINLLRNRW